VCSECNRGWQHGGGAVEEMTPAAVERAQCDAQWIGDIDSTICERARQEISPATRRKVLHRDQGRCQVPGCRAHANLDVHHIQHRAHGGTNDLWNLITLCEAHHLCHHEGTLRIERVGDELRFRREGRNAFTRATRIVARDAGVDAPVELGVARGQDSVADTRRHRATDSHREGRPRFRCAAGRASAWAPGTARSRGAAARYGASTMSGT
jgi:hypothetical protein